MRLTVVLVFCAAVLARHASVFADDDDTGASDEVEFQPVVHDFDVDDNGETDGFKDTDYMFEMTDQLSADDLTDDEQLSDDDEADQQQDPPNFWSYMENLIPGSQSADAPKGNPLARGNIVPHISSADGHEDWRRLDVHLVDDSGLMHFLEDSDDDSTNEVDDRDKFAEDDDRSILDNGGDLAPAETISIQQSIDADYDLARLETKFRCSDVDSLVFDTASNPNNLYLADRRNRMDFLVYEISGRVPEFDVRRDVAVHWVYTSPEGQECELPEPGTKDEFLLTRQASCDFDRDFVIGTYPIPDRNAVCTSLQLNQEDLLNFLPGKFGVKFYFRCHHDEDDIGPQYIRSWTSTQSIGLDYRRPTKSWFYSASPEVTIAVVILFIGLLSGLLAVFLWKKMLPSGTEGFQYSKLSEKIVKAVKPTWV